MKISTSDWLQGLQANLLVWFETSGRNYPWRKTKRPFRILVAEKLLQQTRVTDKVLIAYKTLLARYPKPLDLAQANLSDVKRIIKPLGLSFRAKHLIIMSRELTKKHQGKVPQNYEDLISLTGVGEYCARAVLNFAFHKDYAVIDTNVGRFLFRLFDIKKEFPANPSRKKYLVDLAQSILPNQRSRDFNFAILDLCAAICKPGIPHCGKCPIEKYCHYSNKSFANS